jgi:hypothetical protein
MLRVKEAAKNCKRYLSKNDRHENEKELKELF